jgi:hypothetical protein
MWRSIKTRKYNAASANLSGATDNNTYTAQLTIKRDEPFTTVHTRVR